jgi:hypothetical protein
MPRRALIILFDFNLTLVVTLVPLSQGGFINLHL